MNNDLKWMETKMSELQLIMEQVNKGLKVSLKIEKLQQDKDKQEKIILIIILILLILVNLLELELIWQNQQKQLQTFLNLLNFKEKNIKVFFSVEFNQTKSGFLIVVDIFQVVDMTFMLLQILNLYVHMEFVLKQFNNIKSLLLIKKFQQICKIFKYKSCTDNN